jgi:large subunit ribosomal protein L21
MYAVIASGGKQRRVETGDVVELELLGAEGEEITLRPVLVVDGEAVLATPAELGGASVAGRVLGEAKGPKINGFLYKNKSNNRKRWGHRQRYSRVEITEIKAGPSGPTSGEGA